MAVWPFWPYLVGLVLIAFGYQGAKYYEENKVVYYMIYLVLSLIGNIFTFGAMQYYEHNSTEAEGSDKQAPGQYSFLS